LSLWQKSAYRLQRLGMRDFSGATLKYYHYWVIENEEEPFLWYVGGQLCIRAFLRQDAHPDEGERG
jgi:hypothetical protein